MARNRHLQLTPLAEARAALLAAVVPLASSEQIAAEDALGRVTAEAVHARSSVPHYHGSAMDGIAVRAADTAGASETAPVSFERGTPDSVPRPFSYVETGNALPSWANAVVMIERVFEGPAPDDVHPPASAAAAPLGATADDCCTADDGSAGTDVTPARSGARLVNVRAAAPPWQHVRLAGEDVVASQLLLPRGHTVRPYDVGALLAAGVVEVAVRPRPLVAILPTGDELIEPGAARRPGRIVEFNSRMVASFVREWGGEPVRLAPVGDNLDAIRSRIAQAVREADVLCVIAGSSAGEHDFTALALSSIGEVLAHGIALMPGKPAIVAAIPARHEGGASRARVALGLPGYPVSAAVICRELLEPLLARLLGKAPGGPATLRAITPAPLRSRVGQEELVRVTVGRVRGRALITPLDRGAGAITTMVRADGIVRIPPDVEVVAAGAEVEVELLRPLAEVLGTIVVSGSEDPVLGVLEDVLRAATPRYKLSVRSVGGRAGLQALARGEAHVAATHRPTRDAAGDHPGDGSARGVARLLRGQPALVVHLVERELGLVVAPGNPLALRSVADLLRDDVRTPPQIKRSAVLFLSRALDGAPAARQAAMPPDGNDGGAYHHDEGVEHQEIAPLAVAVAVQSRLADAGLGTAGAAAALGLGFVPIAREDYELVLPADVAASELGLALLAAIRSDAFRTAVARLTGYDTTRTGAAEEVA